MADGRYRLYNSLCIYDAIGIACKIKIVLFQNIFFQNIIMGISVRPHGFYFRKY